MPKMKVNDIQIYYQEIGSGEPLVMIMGLGGDLTAWAFQTPVFSQEFRCIVFDNRGAGRTDHPDTPYTIRMMARDTVSLLDGLGIDRAHVLGLSMGGMIAQEIAINEPSRVLSLQLHATLAKPDPYLQAVVATLVRARATFSKEEFARALLLWMFAPNTYSERPQLVELLVAPLRISRSEIQTLGRPWPGLGPPNLRAPAQ